MDNEETKMVWVIMDDDGYMPPKISVFSTEEKCIKEFERILREQWEEIAAHHPDIPEKKITDDNGEYFDECLEGLAVLYGTRLVKVYEAPLDKMSEDYEES